MDDCGCYRTKVRCRGVKFATSTVTDLLGILATAVRMLNNIGGGG